MVVYGANLPAEYLEAMRGEHGARAEPISIMVMNMSITD